MATVMLWAHGFHVWVSNITVDLQFFGFWDYSESTPSFQLLGTVISTGWEGRAFGNEAISELFLMLK